MIGVRGEGGILKGGKHKGECMRRRGREAKGKQRRKRECVRVRSSIAMSQCL